MKRKLGGEGEKSQRFIADTTNHGSYLSKLIMHAGTFFLGV